MLPLFLEPLHIGVNLDVQCLDIDVLIELHPFGKHGDRKHIIFRIPPSERLADPEVIFVTDPVQAHFPCEDVAENHTHRLPFTDLILANQFPVDDSLQDRKIAPVTLQGQHPEVPGKKIFQLLPMPAQEIPLADRQVRHKGRHLLNIEIVFFQLPRGQFRQTGFFRQGDKAHQRNAEKDRIARTLQSTHQRHLHFFVSVYGKIPACRKRNHFLDLSTLERINASPLRLALAITGGGSSAISEILAEPGASNTLLEAVVPYDPGSLAEFLGRAPDRACSALTARQLAMAAFQRALHLTGSYERIAGVGCTAALATGRERRGADRCHIAAQTIRETKELTLSLPKDLSRQEQEALCRETIINLLAETAGLPQPADNDRLQSRSCIATENWQSLMAGDLAHDGGDDITALLPGAFDPIHRGHRKMVDLAESRLGKDVHLEISIRNVDKPPLDFLEMTDRRARLADFSVVFSNAPTFAEKATLFPGAVFVVGADTILRVGDPKYYASAGARDAAIGHIISRGNRFLVFGRSWDHAFRTLAESSLPAELASICDGLTEKDFREDISSTALRGES